MKKYKIFEFDGGEGAASSAQGAAVEPTENREGNGAENGTEGSSHAPEGKAKERLSFKDLLKSDQEYKKEYDASVKNAIQRRFGDYNDVKTENSKLSEISRIVQDLYPDLRNMDTDQIIESLRQKTDIWAEAASKAGMPVESYMQMMQVQRENEQILGERRAEQEAMMRQQKYQEWHRQEMELQTIYPNFDLTNELSDKKFVDLVDLGWNLKDAYESVHSQEIMDGAIKTAEKLAAEKTAQAIRTGQGRTKENGVGGANGGSQKLDVSKMTDQQIQELVERARNGERVIL